MARREMNPLTSLGDLRREMDRLFDYFVGGVNRGLPFRGRNEPLVDIREDAEAVIVEAEVPGMTMDCLEVHVLGNELKISGRRSAAEAENVTVHRQERTAGEFTRFVNLPVEVDTENVHAVLKDGLLTVTLPKTETGKAKKIVVKGD